MKKVKTKFIFVVGGVMSGVGKGITTSSIAQLLSNKGFNVSAIKIDPYINVDAGTMNPVEHGEVFVTEDGDQTDQDIGNYERFLNKNIYKENYMTTGRVYQSVISRERSLGYEGKCVQVIPHIPLEVRERIKKASAKSGAEIMVIEVGGTVGEYENLLFLEAARVMKLRKPEDVLFVMVSYLPIPNKIGEMKTKPTQHAVRSLNTAGIQPNFVVARAERTIDDVRREKIAIHCNISVEDVISAPDTDSIYEIPLNFEKSNFANKILKKLNLKTRHTLKGRENHQRWLEMIASLKNPQKEIDVAVIARHFVSGDYTVSDSYVSLIEAIKHASAYNKVKVNLKWLKADSLKNNPKILKDFAGVIMPQAWGAKGAEGKIEAIKYCRQNKIPFLAMSYGMQMAIIEFARNIVGIKDANSEEVNPKTKNKIIVKRIKSSQKKDLRENLRLGAWPCKLTKNTKLEKIYSKYGFKDVINERHRHSYEFNNDYRGLLEKKGLVFSGVSPDGQIVEAIEIKDHPFFIAVQFQPEYISRPLSPHPLFVEFVKVLKNQK